MTRPPLPAVLVLAVVTMTCGDPTGPGMPHAGEFPDRLSQIAGVPTDLSSTWTPADPGARIQIPFAPHWPLWTNGSEKRRVVVLPPGTVVNTALPASWSLPEGTLIFKTFSYRSPQGALRHIETRVFRRVGTGWETGGFLWRDDQSDAERLDGRGQVPVSVTRQDGLVFDHVIPSADDCQNCHASSPTFVLGFNARQLGESPGGGAPSRLAELEQAGLLSDPLVNPPRVPLVDATTRAVLGYVMGNCFHCHNGSRAFSMDPEVFVDSTVNQPAPRGGTLIAPGDPENSVLYQRVRDRIMPPLGVQVQDTTWIAQIEAWIRGL